VGVLEPGRGLDLGKEALAPERGREVGVEHLDGDLAIMANVVRQVHGRHAALAQLPLDAVAVLEGGGEGGDAVGHTAICPRRGPPGGCVPN